jgi:hypothetical protein
MYSFSHSFSCFHFTAGDRKINQKVQGCRNRGSPAYEEGIIWIKSGVRVFALLNASNLLTFSIINAKCVRNANSGLKEAKNNNEIINKQIKRNYLIILPFVV